MDTEFAQNRKSTPNASKWLHVSIEMECEFVNMNNDWSKCAAILLFLLHRRRKENPVISSQGKTKLSQQCCLCSYIYSNQIIISFLLMSKQYNLTTYLLLFLLHTAYNFRVYNCLAIVTITGIYLTHQTSYIFTLSKRHSCSNSHSIKLSSKTNTGIKKTKIMICFKE